MQIFQGETREEPFPPYVVRGTWQDEGKLAYLY